MKVHELLEALKPSQYRGLVKDWDKSRYADIFRRYTTDPKAYRIYMPLKGGARKVKPPKAIADAVAEAGYEVEDYATGIASKDGGRRKVKIGKLLKDPDLLQKFANDPKRGGATTTDYTVVISRHPYDVAGMSTDRGWTSCMNLDSGTNKEYLPAEVAAGTLVAYLVKGDDSNISAPVARMNIKPFFSPSTDDIAFGIQKAVYGTKVPGFTLTVKKWVDEVNKSNQLDGLFHWDDKLYDDRFNDHGEPPASLAFGETGAKMPKIIDAMYSVPYAKRGEFLEKAGLSEKEMAELLSREPSLYPHVKNPTERMKLATVKSPQVTRDTLKTIDDPSYEVQRAAIQRNPTAIEYVKDPSEELQLLAVRGDAWVLRTLKDPSEKVKLAAVRRDGKVIGVIKDPSEQLQLAAVNSEPYAVASIKKPSPKAQMAAVKRSMSAFQVMGHKVPVSDMSEEVLMYVAKNRPGFIFLLNKKDKVPPKVLAAAEEAEEAFQAKYGK